MGSGRWGEKFQIGVLEWQEELTGDGPAGSQCLGGEREEEGERKADVGEAFQFSLYQLEVWRDSDVVSPHTGHVTCTRCYPHMCGMRAVVHACGMDEAASKCVAGMWPPTHL
eukprot:360897-Chlamydomonas_euryale.AAC.3